jgi:hypothetical protein
MGLIKQPYEVSTDFTLKALIYGQPGIGKSTLALSAPNPILIDCDNGVHRIAPNHRVPFLPVKSYDEVLDVINGKDIADFQTIVIDTAGKLLDYMVSYLIKQNPKDGKTNGDLSLQGYGSRKREFIRLLKKVSTMNKHLIFVAHETEERKGDGKVKRPEIGGSSGGDLIKELDLVGYMEAIGRKRTISFTPCEEYYAKNSARMDDVIELPELKGTQANATMTTIIDKCRAAVKEEGEQLQKYNELMKQIGYDISGIGDAEWANKIFAKLGKYSHIWDSKMKAWEMLQIRAEELNLTFDKEGKKYVQNQPKSA